MKDKAKKIKCLAYFDTLDSTDNRTNNPAAFTKASYIFDCFRRLGYEVDILSASGTVGKKACKGKTRLIGDGITLTTLSCLGRGSRIKNVIGRFLLYLNLFIRLLFFVDKGDVLWVYHSLALMWVVRLLKTVKRFTLLLEVEELYGDVMKSSKTVNRELEFFKCGDAYIFCTGLLNDVANPQNKPYAVAHGTYKPEPCYDVSFCDEKLHVVYAGTFSSKKGGVYTAVNTALYLNEKYHLHILGSGSGDEIKKVTSLIKKTADRCRCTLTYDGCILGEEYSKFLQRCHIGLSTQNPYEPFSNSSFPSKILVYMANGLRVVSVKIPVVEQSGVGRSVSFYNNPNPEEVAKAIKNVDLKACCEGREIIQGLDKAFLADLRLLLDSLWDMKK